VTGRAVVVAVLVLAAWAPPAVRAHLFHKMYEPPETQMTRDTRLLQLLLDDPSERFPRLGSPLLGDDELVGLARDELRLLGIGAEPHLTLIHRWPRGMPQYVLGHPERLARIGEALERYPGLALAGAAYRGVGVPDCIRSGEEAAEAVARVLARVAG